MKSFKTYMACNRWLFLGVLIALVAGYIGAEFHPALGLAAFAIGGTVSFNYIPTNVRVPLFYAEMDNSQAGYFTQNKRTLLCGQKLAAGTAVVNTPYLVSTTDAAKTLFGTGSMLARMHALYRNQDAFGEVWCIAVADAGGVAATGTITVTGPATAAGTISLYIAGQRVIVAVGSTDLATVIATSIAAAINAATDLPVTASPAAAVVTLTCKWKGLTGNDITMLDSFRGFAGGESLPTGVTLAYSGSGLLTAGTINPTITGTLITAMGDDEYDYVVNPWTDSTTLDAFALEYNDSVGRWSWSRQVYGHCYSALRGTLGTLTTAGGLRNDPHHTIAGIDNDCPMPCYEYAAAYGGANALGLNVDTGRPTQTLPLTGILSPRAGKRFLLTERQSLLNYGIATSYVSGGQIRVERAITTYQKNAWSQSDPSYLDSETLHQLTEITRRLRNRITQKYPRHKLANDGTRFGAGQAIVTPSIIRGEILAEYYDMEQSGLVENHDLFVKYLIVERDAGNPNRVNVLLPPDLVNQLRIFALLNQFRLQYPANA